MSQDGSHGRRTFLKAAGSAAAAVTLAGCTGGDGGNGSSGNGTNNTDDGGTETNRTPVKKDKVPEGGTVTYARGEQSSTLDPQNTTSGVDVKIITQFYNTLIEWQPGTTKLKDGLAKKWTLEGKTTTLTLKEGITFHNGDEFTAEDFVATYRRFTDPSYKYYPGDKYTSGYGPFTLGNWIKKLETDGKYKLTIEMTQKYAPFLRNLAMFAASVLSKKAIKKYGKKLKSNPVGTGPFKLKSWNTSSLRIRLTAYDDYWGDGPYVDEALFRVIPENTTRAQTLVSGGVDIIDGLGTQGSKVVKNGDGVELLSIQGINIGYLALNFERFKPFRDKKVRQAVNYAINTKAIVNAVFKGIAVQASQPITEKMLGYNEKLDPYPHDPDKAKKLLKEAGYGDGISFTLTTFKNPRPYNPSPLQAAQVVKSNLAKVGISMDIKPMPFAPLIEYTAKGKHDACFLGWMTDNADPDNFYYTLFHPQVSKDKIPKGQDWVSFDTKGYNTLNVSGWANSKFMKVTEKGQTTYDTKKRAKLYKKAGEIMHDEVPVVLLDHAKAMRGVRKEVVGMFVAPIGGPYLNLIGVKK
jgi:peptide/nickel transport system substrate-binding protein